MKNTLLFLLIALTAFVAAAQTGNTVADLNPGFEKITAEAKLPDKWTQWGKGFDVKIDKTEKKSGEVSVSLEPANGVKADGAFGAIAFQIPANFAGKEVELRGFLKMKDVSDGVAGMFLRIDGESGVLQFDNMQDRDLKGTSDWTEHSIKLPLPEGAVSMSFGALLAGNGKMWADDLQILIDGKDIREAKTVAPPVYKAAQDKEFDAGSKIAAVKLSKAKIADLAVLGKVWGFLKYHHPAVMRGDHNFDYELFRVMPKILAAKYKNERNAALLAWSESLGAIETDSSAKPANAPNTAEVKLKPDLVWINAANLGDKLTQHLERVKNAKRENKSYYISMMPNVGNPQFRNEDAYTKMSYPDTGFRLLSLFRYWNIIQYYFPNKHLIEENWNDVLAEFVPLFANAADELEYKKAALALIARIHDTHANIWGKQPVLDKLRGLYAAPVTVTFVEEQAVVTKYWDEKLAEKVGLKRGDVIEAINGKKVSDIVKEWLPLTPASNYPTQLRDIARFLLMTNDNFLNIKFRRENVSKEVRIDTYLREDLRKDFGAAFMKEPESFKLIGKDISYLYPGTLKSGEIAKLIPEIAKTKGLIIDLRSYPSDFIVFSLGEFLQPKPTDFVKFSIGSVTAPGLFVIRDALKVGKEGGETYQGKVVVMINETTQSQAEYTTMAFRTAPRVTVIGSTTAGADGNVSQFSLPGGISTMISGIGVYYPDGRETQRIGIVPDVVVKPTVKGVKDGRDEVLEKAIEIIKIQSRL